MRHCVLPQIQEEGHSVACPLPIHDMIFYAPSLCKASMGLCVVEIYFIAIIVARKRKKKSNPSLSCKFNFLNKNPVLLERTYILLQRDYYAWSDLIKSWYTFHFWCFLFCFLIPCFVLRSVTVKLNEFFVNQWNWSIQATICPFWGAVWQRWKRHCTPKEACILA